VSEGNTVKYKKIKYVVEKLVQSVFISLMYVVYSYNLRALALSSLKKDILSSYVLNPLCFRVEGNDLLDVLLYTEINYIVHCCQTAG
jgi:hypothetical protein